MPDSITAFAPGRVNLIGEHTDYNQGLALPFAIDRGITVQATSRSTARVDVIATDLDEHDTFATADPQPVPGWRVFARAAVAELQRSGFEPPGAHLRISGNLPQGAGLSSSAALAVALTTALIALGGRQLPSPLELARICSRIENDWVGAQTGLLDQLASLLGRRDHAVLIDFQTMDVQPIPLELDNHRLIVLNSGEQHNNAASAYNQRRGECDRAAARLGLASLRDAKLSAINALPLPLADRARHVTSENHRVREAVEALQRRDLDTLADLLSRSHVSMRDDFAASTPAVEATVRQLLQAGATGARMIGGGFGGCVLALISRAAALPDGAFEVRPSVGAWIDRERSR